VKKIRVAIADDSSLFRAVLRQLLEAEGDITVVGEAADGERAIELVGEEVPDLLTVDMQMPGIGGLETIARVMARTPVPILVVTGQSAAPGSHLVFEAIGRGALELVEKGALSDDDGHALRSLARRLASVQVVRHLHVARSAPPAAAPPRALRTMARDRVAIAASSGGPSTLATLLKPLPGTFPACVAVVQHLPVGFTQAFARFLREHISLRVVIVEERVQPQPGVVLLPPDNRHLVITPEGLFAPSEQPAIGGHRPSATALFRSMAQVCAGRTAGVVLTGMGEDGAAGLLELRQAGGLTFAQDQKSAAVYGMPKAAVDAGAVGEVLGLSELSQALLRVAGEMGKNT
jgi:two-component system chemotaxis response regulator CheB